MDRSFSKIIQVYTKRARKYFDLQERKSLNILSDYIYT